MDLGIVLLTLIIIMPQGVPDKKLQRVEPSAHQCAIDAAEFLEHGVPDAIPEGKAILVSCLAPKDLKT